MNLTGSAGVRRVWMASGKHILCLTAVAGTTYVSFSLFHTNALVSALAYLLIVLVVAARWGLMESTVTSLAATLLLNFFFLPPILTLTIADPQNWVALFVFMATAITASQLSAMARQRTLEAQARKTEVERLYELSRSLMMQTSNRDVGTQIAEGVRAEFGFTTVALCNAPPAGKVDFAGPENRQLAEQVLRDIASKDDYNFLWRGKTAGGEEIVLGPIS